MTAFRPAESEARALNHSSIGSHHLMLRLFLLKNGVHFSVLRQLGFTAESVQQDIIALEPQTSGNPKQNPMPIFQRRPCSILSIKPNTLKLQQNNANQPTKHRRRSGKTTQQRLPIAIRHSSFEFQH